MARVDASRTLLAPRDDVWSLLSEPHHLADWWPGYRAVRPDRRGVAEGARWTGVRSPEAEGLMVIGAVDRGRSLAWHDVQEAYDVTVELADDGEVTAARVTL